MQTLPPLKINYSPAEIEKIMNNIENASPQQLQYLQQTLCEAFPDIAWAKRDLIDVLKAVLSMLLESSTGDGAA